MSFAKYPEYKDSGVEWLGEVPEHWEVRPIKALALLKGGAGFPDAEQGLENEELYFYKVGSLGQANARGILQAAPDSISRDTAMRLGAFVFPAGTLTFAKVGAALLLARIRQLPAPSCLDNNMMGMLVTEASDARFVLFAMSLVRFDLIANPGAVPSLNAGQIGDFQLAVPPLPEQTAIATFLDRETAKIDALVAEQEKLIALLQEKRQAVISHAVTKGLNPNAPMKDSGVEWLGEVPEHWEVSSLRHSLEEIFNGLTAEQIDPSESTVPVTRIETISNGNINFEKVGFVSKDDARSDRKLIFGDICFSNINSLKMIGNCAMYLGEQELYGGMNLLVLRPIQTRDPRYLYWVIRSDGFRKTVESYAKPAINQASISQSSLAGIGICIPHKEEQTAIATFLDRETVKLDTLMTEARTAITLLQERRTALISAAVTGQIDVRGWVPASEASIS